MNMASLLLLNMQEFNYKPSTSGMSKICICCASQNAVLINISTCKHTGFLTNYLKLELDLKKTYICNLCHHMLKKIEIFKQQVQESVALLFEQAPILEINKLHNLEIAKNMYIATNDIEVEIEADVIIDTAVKIEPIETINDIFTENENGDLRNDNGDNTNVNDDLKNEIESSDNDTEMPLSQLKLNKIKNKTKNVMLYDGKIEMVLLNDDDVKKERENMAAKENYLKLPFKCVSCILAFDHEETFQSHMDGRHKKIVNGFECKVCKCTFESKFSYTEHVQRHYRRFECVVCKKRYNHMTSATQHFRVQHVTDENNTQLFGCRLCDYTTKNRRALRYHLDKHKAKPVCNICGNQFVNSYGLKLHMFTVHQQSSRKFKCEECNKQYKARSGLEAHIKAAHSAPDNKAFCALCKTYYRNKQTLATHINTHSRHVGEGEKRFTCDECGAKFATKRTLLVHINWEHLKLNQHCCTQCNKVFKESYSLNRHVAYVHNKERPPRNKICDYCGKAFTTQTILKSHIRTHTGERPLQCSHCTATFAHPAALYTHKKLLHSGNKK